MENKNQWKLGQVVYTAEGEWSNGRPMENMSEYRATAEEAKADAEDEMGWLTEDEQKRANIWVSQWTITDIDEDGNIGCLEGGGTID